MNADLGRYGLTRFILHGTVLAASLVACSTLSQPAPAASRTPEQPAGDQVNPLLPSPTPTAALAFVSNGIISMDRDGRPMEYTSGNAIVDGGEIPLSTWHKIEALESFGDIYQFELRGIDRSNPIGEDPAQAPAINLSFSATSIEAGRQIEYVVSVNSEGLESAELSFIEFVDGELVIFQMIDGMLRIEVLAASPGESASVSGTFSGVFAFRDLFDPEGGIDPNRSFTVSDGTFEITAIPFVSFAE